jgi:hypothetical protein
MGMKRIGRHYLRQCKAPLAAYNRLQMDLMQRYVARGRSLDRWFQHRAAMFRRRYGWMLECRPRRRATGLSVRAWLVASICAAGVTSLAASPRMASIGGATAFAFGDYIVMLERHENALEREVQWLHEATHVAQFREGGTLRTAARWLTSAPARLDLEAEAYATGLCVHRRALPWAEWERLAKRESFARWLVEMPAYRLRSVSREEAAKRLDLYYRGGLGCDALLQKVADAPAPVFELR